MDRNAFAARSRIDAVLEDIAAGKIAVLSSFLLTIHGATRAAAKAHRNPFRMLQRGMQGCSRATDSWCFGKAV